MKVYLDKDGALWVEVHEGPDTPGGLVNFTQEELLKFIEANGIEPQSESTIAGMYGPLTQIAEALPV